MLVANFNGDTAANYLRFYNSWYSTGFPPTYQGYAYDSTACFLGAGVGSTGEAGAMTSFVAELPNVQSPTSWKGVITHAFCGSTAAGLPNMALEDSAWKSTQPLRNILFKTADGEAFAAESAISVLGIV
jgi:hypothetical protein